MFQSRGWDFSLSFSLSTADNCLLKGTFLWSLEGTPINQLLYSMASNFPQVTLLVPQLAMSSWMWCGLSMPQSGQNAAQPQQPWCLSVHAVGVMATQ